MKTTSFYFTGTGTTRILYFIGAANTRYLCCIGAVKTRSLYSKGIVMSRSLFYLALFEKIMSSGSWIVFLSESIPCSKYIIFLRDGRSLRFVGRQVPGAVRKRMDFQVIWEEGQSFLSVRCWLCCCCSCYLALVVALGFSLSLSLSLCFDSKGCESISG